MSKDDEEPDEPLAEDQVAEDGPADEPPGGELSEDLLPPVPPDDEDFDPDEDDDEDDDDESDGSEEGEAAPAAAKKSKKESDEEDLGDPKTPVPSLKVMRAAMAEIFANEEIDSSVLDYFAKHALMVLESNRVMNLTTIFDPREIAAKHYLDSWRLTQYMPLFGRTVLDLGTGAGFPGIPIALGEEDARVTLCDAKEKRLSYLESCVKELGLKNTKVVCEKAEEHMTTNKYDVVLVRNVSSVRENVRLLRKVRHSLKDLVMLKGSSWSREVRAGEREAERLGFHLDTVWEHELAAEMGGRAILVYRAPGGQGL